ncbi:putative Neurocalcin [Fasciola hepatica]|uniref:Neurocalcin n=1 Tax=Fasciola hepatica TaxID=6192 RepID=A0A4E0RIF3_FASHE|nr:putative Neurocalcin [Fasciola hepatica]
MAQKILEPFRKLPHQIHNFGFIQRIHDFATGKVDVSFGNCLGRLISIHADGFIELHELSVKAGTWVRRSRVCVVNPDCELLTCMAIGDKVVYVGSSAGTLRQIAREGGRLCAGEESLTACTASMVVETVPLDKRQDVHVDSPIVSLAMQPEGNHLLVAYASGCVAVAIPQPLMDTAAVESRSGESAPTAEVEPTTPNTEECPVDAGLPSTPAALVNEAPPEAAADPSQSPVTGTPVKGSGERRATLKLKGLTRSLRGTDSAKPEVETEPKIAVPPAPRISHLLIRDQTVESAAWRVTSIGSLSTEVVIAYGDGAFQIWPVVAAVTQQPQEPIIVSKREPPSTPYGPLPCGAIRKILINPGEHGGVLTAFSGGLPRPEFQDRHAVTVMQGQEHHLPYLSCLNLSPITAVAHLSQVPSPLLQSFPCDSDFIWGGCNESKKEVLSDKNHSDVTILGEANGLVSMFVMSKGDCIYRIGTLLTASLFAADGGSCSQGQEHHVCFQFGSEVKDFLFIPKKETAEMLVTESDCNSSRSFAVAALLVLTERELLAVDLMRPDWPVLQLPYLIVGGAGGHVSLWTAGAKLNCIDHSPVAFEPDVARIHANLIDPETTTKYVWKGPSALRPFEGVTQLYDSTGAVFIPHALIQLDPPAPITSIACEQSWNLLAVGSLHGFAVIDLLAKSTIHVQLLYDRPLKQKITHAVSSVQRELVSRGKQITASMRQSFRRLKQFRSSSVSGSKSSETTTDANQPKTSAESAEQPHEMGDETPITAEEAEKAQVENAEAGKTTDEGEVGQPHNLSEDAKEKEGDENAEVVEDVEIITLPSEDNPGSVRSLLFVDTFLLSPPNTDETQPKATKRTPSLWVGTSNGRAIAYVLKWDGTQGPVKVQLLKELQLRHQAPIIGMCVIDAGSKSPVSSTPRKRNSCEPPPSTVDVPVEKPSEEKSAPFVDCRNSCEPPPSTVDVPVEKPSEEKSDEARTPADVHQFLVCSDEQVRLFSLPALRALHKHKYVDRIRLPYGVGQITLTSDSPNTKSEKQVADAAEHGEAVGEEESKGQQYHRKSLTAIGVQCFTRDGSDQPKDEWFVIAVRRDCKGSILTLPHLRQICKLRKYVDADVHPVHCVSSLSNANLILWNLGRQLFVQELTSVPRLLSSFCCAPGRSSPSLTLTLPEWARPGDATQLEVTDETQNPTLNVMPAMESSDEPTTEVVGPSVEDQARVSEKPIPYHNEREQEVKMADDAIPGVPQAGDLTLDSIKEYLNGDNMVTVKTFESSTEKHTLVEGGRIVTTLHETEKIDGKVMKDDVVKFTSDGENTTPMITDSS